MPSSKYVSPAGPPAMRVGVHIGTALAWTLQDPSITETDMTDKKVATERLFDPKTGQLVAAKGMPLPDNHADLVTAAVALGTGAKASEPKPAPKTAVKVAAKPPAKTA